MNATIISRTSAFFTLQLEIPYNGSMLDFEEALQDRLNEAGGVATAEGLQPFDTDGSPITVGPGSLPKGRSRRTTRLPRAWPPPPGWSPMSSPRWSPTPRG
jgi:hypothetical protein